MNALCCRQLKAHRQTCAVREDPWRERGKRLKEVKKDSKKPMARRGGKEEGGEPLRCTGRSTVSRAVEQQVE